MKANMAELEAAGRLWIANNQYAMGTSVNAQRRNRILQVSFNIPGEQVDGMDVEAVYAAAVRNHAAMEWSDDPEMKTYRYRGHSMSDPAKYRSREEVQSVRDKRDPIEHFGQKLIARKLATEDDLKAMDKEIRQIVNHATEFATESAEPHADELYTDVLA